MFDSLRNTTRELGWGTALLYWLSRALDVVSGGRARVLAYRLVAQPVAAQDLTPPGRGRAIEVSEASPAAIAATDFGRPASVISRRQAIGSRCLLAHKDGQLIGFQWFSTHSYPEDEVRCLFELRPEDRCAWDFDIFVLPEYRTQPVFTRLWDRCNATLRIEGIGQSLSRINAFNSASARAHARLGARPIGTAVFLRLGSWQLSWLPEAPRFHLSRRSTPRIAASLIATRQREEARVSVRPH